MSGSRRDWLAALPALFLALAGLVKRRGRPAVVKLPLPGAAPAFAARCIRCYRCAEVCPPKAIRFDSGVGPSGDLPFIEASERACILCMRCTEVCPTDALEPIVASLQAVQAGVKLGIPVLAKGKCLPWSNRGICRLCYYVCPYPDQAVRLGGPRQSPVFDATACVGCGLCEEACPEVARAIRIVPREVT